MQIKTGYLYHIKDEYFNKINDENVMQNHEKGKKRPTYFTIKDGKILWFIPISSKVDKYKNIVNNKIKKYGVCNTILIEKIFEEESAILIQNAFPTLEKYIDHVHIKDGKPARVPEKLEKIIYKDFKEVMELHNRGIKVFFTDIDKLKLIMLDEINEKISN